MYTKVALEGACGCSQEKNRQLKKAEGQRVHVFASSSPPRQVDRFHYPAPLIEGNFRNNFSSSCFFGMRVATQNEYERKISANRPLHHSNGCWDFAWKLAVPSNNGIVLADRGHCRWFERFVEPHKKMCASIVVTLEWQRRFPLKPKDLRIERIPRTMPEHPAKLRHQNRCNGCAVEFTTPPEARSWSYHSYYTSLLNTLH